MPRYIDADALIHHFYETEYASMYYVEVVKRIIDAQPTISPDEVRGVGKWIKRFDGPYGHGRTYCSACGKHSGIGGIKQTPPYCPNCGAKMEVSEDA